METPTAVGADSHVGTLIAGRFRVLRRLADGGMSSVYLAEDTERHGQVALKLAAQGPHREAAVREAHALAELDHPNIVRLRDSGELDDGGFFLALEHIDGQPLHRLLKQNRFDVHDALKLILPL